MIQTIRKAWRIPELRKKILFTLLILVIYRIGSAIPVPYVDTDTLSAYLQGMSTTILGLYDVMSGGAFAQATVFALGIQPYINSSIIIQLLTVAIPALERLQREGGEEGKKKLQSITRYATVGIALLQALGYYFIMKQAQILTQDNVWVALVIMVSWVAGSSFLMWLGEQCNEFGVGNGISMILFAGIISRVPSMVSSLYRAIVSGTMHWAWTVLIVVGVLLMVVLIVFVNDAERRIPVQYPTEGSFGYALLNAIDTKSFLYLVVYFVLIIGFSYFYASIQFNPVEISNNLKRNGGFIPGFRPGKPTSDFIARVLNKITLFGAIYLGVVAIVPLLADKFMAMSIGIGGTSVIIVVGVALETVQALENQMLMRQYKGFLE